MDRRAFAYSFSAYALFFAFIGVTGVAMLLLDAPSPVIEGLTILAAWSPTFALLLLFTRLVPGKTRTVFIRDQFRARIDGRSWLMTVLPIPLMGVATICIASIIRGEPLSDLIILSPTTLLLVATIQMFSGASGEELGWRGFLLPHLRRRQSFIKATLITGFIWCIWHSPLWILSDFQGMRLVVYVICFVNAITCCNIMIAYVYDRCRNLVLPILIHFLNNFFLQILTFDLVQGLALFSGGYLIATTFLVALEEPRRRNREERRLYELEEHRHGRYRSIAHRSLIDQGVAPYDRSFDTSPARVIHYQETHSKWTCRRL